MSKWSTPSKPSEVKNVPWLGAAVITRLSEIITKEFNVIEHGSGGSSLWFAERASFVMSIENNHDWYKEVLKRKKRNMVLVYNNWPAVPDNWMDFKSFDLLLIDGEPVEERALWIVESKMIVKEKGWVVLDNANRPEYETERKYLHSISETVETFDCNEGSKYLVTDICRLK
jgi:hypothetical protein